MKSTYRILFIIKKSKVNKDGLATVSARISIDGQSVEFSPKLSANASLWNPIGKMNGKTKEVRDVNDTLDKVKADLKFHYEKLFDRDGYVTPEKLRDSYVNKNKNCWAFVMITNELHGFEEKYG